MLTLSILVTATTVSPWWGTISCDRGNGGVKIESSETDTRLQIYFIRHCTARAGKRINEGILILCERLC
jgi:hypothetical protein